MQLVIYVLLGMSVPFNLVSNNLQVGTCFVNNKHLYGHEVGGKRGKRDFLRDTAMHYNMRLADSAGQFNDRTPLTPIDILSSAFTLFPINISQPFSR
jgi:hypothetical protein